MRTQRALSIRGLAALSGLSAGYLSRVERDVYNPPKISTIERLADALALNDVDRAILVRLSARIGGAPRECETALQSDELSEGPTEQILDRLRALEGRVERIERCLGLSKPDQVEKHHDG